MITLLPIHTSHPSYPFVEELFVAAFPEDERRDTPLQRHNVDHHPSFCCCLIERQGEAVGFVTYWDFDGFCYIEHFAVAPAYRNGGIGGEAIRALQARVARPLVLEVELPEDELSQRRIGFYRRQGLSLWEQTPYIQPSYRGTQGNALPMHLMATEGLNEYADAERVIACIHKEVYGAIKN